jgi:uncharacterized protein YndB with AHSA1/START domain
VTDGPGTVTAGPDGLTLRFERRYDAAPDEVWAALTEPESIRRWLLAEAVLEPRVGGAFRLDWRGLGSAGGSVLTWAPPRLLEVEWNEGELRTHLRIAIAAAADGALLLLEHRAVAPGAGVRMGAGWDAHLTALGEALAGRDGIDARWRARFDDLVPRYEALVAAAPGSSDDGG